MQQILDNYSQEIITKASGIKMLVMDVDGVLTDGKIIYTNSGDEIKAFNVKDGQIIKFLKKAGIKVGVITGRNSALVEKRCIELKLDFFHQGVKDKWSVIESERGTLSADEICYIGDDIIDLESIRKSGLGVTPDDALEYIKAYADLVTDTRGGEGVVREVADLVLASQGSLQLIITEKGADAEV